MEVERLLSIINWNSDPFKWFYEEESFSPEKYEEMIKNLPDFSKYRKYNDLYPNRYLFDTTTDSFWSGVCNDFRVKFGVNIRVQLCHDLPGYSIGPHTDGKKEISTILYYLAKDDKDKHLGTSVYTPKNKDFTCDGKKHHPREYFDLLFTAEYKPNTAFGFIRSDNSFHGVEPTDKERDLIQVSVWR